MIASRDRGEDFGVSRDGFRRQPRTRISRGRQVDRTSCQCGSRLPLRHMLPSCRRITAIHFDRLLIAQAVTEPMMLYTADAQLEAYSELVHRI